MNSLKISFVLLLSTVFCAAEEVPTQCNRPKKLVEAEAACKTDPTVTSNDGSFLDKIQENVQSAIEQAKSLVNIAKRKLGFGNQDAMEEKADDKPIEKCEYHECIFKKIDVIGLNGYPNATLLKQWVKNNIDNAQDSTVYDDVDNCFKESNPATDMGSANKLLTCETSRKSMECLNNMDAMCTLVKTL